MKRNPRSIPRQAGAMIVELVLVAGLVTAGTLWALRSSDALANDFAGGSTSIQKDLAQDNAALAAQQPLDRLMASLPPSVIQVTCKPHPSAHSVRCRAEREKSWHGSSKGAFAYFAVPAAASPEAFTILNANDPAIRAVRFDKPAEGDTRAVLLNTLGAPEAPEPPPVADPAKL